MNFKKIVAKFLLLCPFFLLSACSPKIDIDGLLSKNAETGEEIVNGEITLADILAGEKLIAIENNNSLYLIDPQYPEPYKLYSFAKNEKPTNPNLESFLVSPQKKWIVWYTPSKGIVVLNIETLKTKVVQQASDFLNTYPYFEFNKDQDVLKFITDEGNIFQKVNLDTFNREVIEIPYPYGNVFKISPDDESILFVSGYGQWQQPTFMFAKNTGKFVQQFSANINLTDRHQVFWAPDSTGVFMISGNILQYYSLSDPKQPENFYKLGDDDEIISSSILADKIFIFSANGYWHVIDYYSRKEVARAPLEIASELQKPRFIPWSESEFLIEETVPSDPTQFNRLWLSNFRGIKKIVMEKYNEVVLKTFPKNLD
jgi:hypothetical protein